MSDSYIWLDEMPQKDIEKYLINLLHTIEHEIVVGYELGVFDPKKMSPKDVIVMISTNIIVNFMGKILELNGVNPSAIKRRLVKMEECLEEIKTTSMRLWTTIETSKVDSSNSH